MFAIQVENHDRIDTDIHNCVYYSHFCVYQNSISILEYDANVSQL
jgi:hypothetical protein